MLPLALRNRISLRLALSAGLICGLSALPARGEDPADASPAPRSFALRAARIHTVSGPVIEDAVLIVRDGKIAALGKASDLDPGDLPVVNFASQTIIPGLVASSWPIEERGDETPSVSPDVFAADGFDYFADRRELLAGGITTLGVSPGRSRLLSGRGLVVKAGGHGGDASARILRRAAGYQVTLGTYPRQPRAPYKPPVLASPDDPFRVVKLEAPVSRGGALRTLKDLFGRAKVHVESLEEVAVGVEKKGSPPGVELEGLRELITRRATLNVRADRTIDLLRAIDLAREFELSLVLESAIEAHRIAPNLAEARVPVVVAGTFVPGQLSADDLTRSTIGGDASDGLAARLSAAGVRVAITSADPNLFPQLLLQALEAVRYGMAREEALRAVTLTPAEILGVDDRVGSLEVGKDADFAVLSEDPFRAGGRVVATFVAGEMVSPGVKEFPGDVTVIRCGRVCTASRGDIPGGVIVVRKGKILAVGDAALVGAFPKAERVIDATSETVIPGLIDAGSQLGLHRDTDVPDASRQAPSGGGGRASYRLVDAIDLSDPQLADVLRAGITTSILSPDPGGYFAGQLTAIKLAAASREEAIIKDPVALLVASVSSSQLKRAKTYHDQWLAYEKAEAERQKRENEKKRREELREVGRRFGLLLAEEEKEAGDDEEDPAKKEPPAAVEPATDEDFDVLRSVFKGELPVVVRVSSDSAVPGVLAGLTDSYEARTIVYGFGELGEAATAELRKRKVGVLVGSRPVWEKSKDETVHLPRALAEAGIPFAFRSGTGSGARHLPLQVAYAALRGWSREQALRAMTIHPARFFGIDDRVGSIEKDRDADLVFLDGEPFGIATRVTRVMVNGKLVYETPRQDGETQ